MNHIVKVTIVAFTALVTGCASSSAEFAATATGKEPIIVFTSKSMNANSSNMPDLNKRMAEKVAAVAAIVTEKAEKSGRKVIRRNMDKGSAQDIVRIIRDERVRPAQLVQVFWSGDDSGNIFLELMTLPIINTSGGVKFGSNTGKRFQIPASGTGSTTTAEKIAEQYVFSQGW